MKKKIIVYSELKEEKEGYCKIFFNEKYYRNFVSNEEKILETEIFKDIEEQKISKNKLVELLNIIIEVLADILNRIHKVDYSTKYWRILLMSFLLYHVDFCYKKYIQIHKLINKYSDSEFYSYLYFCEDNRQITEEEYISSLFAPQLHNLIFSDIITFFNIPALWTETLKPLAPQKKLKKESSLFVFIKKNLKKTLVKATTKKGKTGICLFLSSINAKKMNKENLFDIHLDCNQDFKELIFSKDNNAEKPLLRMKFKEECLKKISEMEYYGFLKIVLMNIYKYLPKDFLEEYELRNIFVKKKVKSIPKKVVTEFGIYGSDINKYFLAYYVEKNAELILDTHSGWINDAYQELGGIVLENKVAQKVYSFAVKPTSFRLLATIENMKNDINEIKDIKVEQKMLYITGTTYLYPIESKMLLIMLAPSDYINGQVKFFSKLREDILSKTIYRELSFYGAMFDQYKIIKEKFLAVEKDKEPQIINSINNSKLIVVDHLGTPILESFLCNIPLIIYFDLTKVLINDKGKEAFELLKKVGIFFDNPEDAAKKVIEIYDDPRKWWFSEDIQTARKYMCDNFIHYSENWQDEWLEELLKEN